MEVKGRTNNTIAASEKRGRARLGKQLRQLRH
jgi:hypothetical protein